MTLNLSMPKSHHQNYEIKPRITVVGVGGAGGNAVNNMIRSNLEGVEFIVCNTDAQALAQSICDRRLQLGLNITQGLGAGSRPDIGRAAAEEVIDQMMAELDGSNMVFITAGMGGGTGTGAAPVIARAAREHGILTVGVVTKPFHFEGTHRMKIAESGINELQSFVDTLIIIPNQNLFRVANEKTTFADAFAMADQVLYSGVRGVTDLMVMPGLINLDFADIRAVMSEMGKAMMGTGEAEGENRAVAAAEAAISNPLLDDVSMKGARGVLINITGGFDMTLFEVDEAANRIRDEVDPEANIIFGSTFDKQLDGKVRISVVATGIDAEAVSQPRPALTLVAKGGRVMSAPASAPVEVPAQQAAAYAGMTRIRDERVPEIVAQQAMPVMQAQAYQQAPLQAAVGGGYAPAPRMTPPQPAPAPRIDTAALARASMLERPAPRVEPRPMPPSVELPLAAAPMPEPAPEPMRTEPVRAEPAYVEPPRAEHAMMEAPAPMPAAPEPAAQPVLEKRRAPGLFSRAATKALDLARQTSADLREATPSSMMNRIAKPEPVMRAPAPQPAAPAPQPAAQARLALDPTDRLTARPSEEDMLDIPAFLRRQAN
ncbi:MAG TPA: cell division protein FtsZ [Candidatus Acidoferrum sp.]|nr:cell division protein FtsZ [Candidatus Acidoferrum sp.]